MTRALSGLILSLILAVVSGQAFAEEVLTDASPPEREPAVALPNPAVNKRTYPGGADEEDLQVQARLPEAGLRTDSRSLQRDVYKGLYNQELKDERKEDVEE